MVVGTTRGKSWNAAKPLQGFSVAWESVEDLRRVSGTLPEHERGVKGGAGRVGVLDGCPVLAVSPGLDPPGPPGPKEQGGAPHHGDDFLIV